MAMKQLETQTTLRLFAKSSGITNVVALIILCLHLAPCSGEEMHTTSSGSGGNDNSLTVEQGIFAGLQLSNSTYSCDAIRVERFVTWGNNMCIGKYLETICSGLCLPDELKPYHRFYLIGRYTPFQQVRMCAEAIREVQIVQLECPEGYDPVKVEVPVQTSCGCRSATIDEFLKTLTP